MDFLTSLAVICLCALLLGSVCSKLRLPPLLGMLMHVDGRETALKEEHGENDGADTAQEERSS